MVRKHWAIDMLSRSLKDKYGGGDAGACARGRKQLCRFLCKGLQLDS